MADVPITVIVPDDEHNWVERLIAMAEKEFNGGLPLTPAQAKTMIQSQVRRGLKRRVLDSEINDSVNTLRTTLTTELESWTE